MRHDSKHKGSNPNPTLHRSEECSRIRSLIEEDQIEKAIQELQVLAKIEDTRIANKLSGVQAWLRRVINDEAAGLLSWNEIQTEKNKITLGLLHLVDQLVVTHSPIRELSAVEKKQRAGYLQDVKADVENRLQVSIHHAPLIDLGIDDTPSAADLPWIYKDRDSKHEFNDYKEAFETYQRRMLLLGAPGSGKTVTLLHIARQLITEAENNPAAPIPLLVNLSKFQPGSHESALFGFIQGRRSHSEKRENPIERWLIKELTANPRVSVEMARTWIEEGRIAALLDGLDEVNDEHRAELVRILNTTYLRRHPDTVVAVCSRVNEYRPLQDRKETRVELAGAVTLQPLTSSKINEYLERAQATELREALLTDETLYQMAQTPLTLSMMTLAYGGLKPSRLPSNLSFTERRHHMMDAYVDRMLQRKERRDRNRQFDRDPDNEVLTGDYTYSPRAVNLFLGWLAVRLSVRMQTAFSLDSFYGFLLREINNDRRSGTWCATVMAQLPILFVSALLIGITLKVGTTQASLEPLYISIVGALLFIPIAWLARSPEDGHRPTTLDKFRKGALSGLLAVAVYLSLGVMGTAFSSVIPLGIPPIPILMIFIFLNIHLVAFFNSLPYERRKPALALVSTLVDFGLGLIVMYSTGSKYGWYIPAFLMATFHILRATIAARYSRLLQIPLVLLIVLSTVVFLAGTVFIAERFRWNVALFAYISVVMVILITVRKALFPLIGFFCFFMLGAILGGDHGAIVGGVLYGYLLLLGVTLVDFDLSPRLTHHFVDLLGFSHNQCDRIADRYLFSPVLMRVLAVSRCFPIRPRKFFRYAEQALLLKRSGGDIEFMHRLLRDFFALRELSPLLTTSDSSRRLQAIRSLGYQGDAAIDALAEFVRDANPDVREAAAWALGKVVSPTVIPHLETALHDVSPKVRRIAVISTENLTNSEKLRLLKIVEHDPDLSVQSALFQATFTLKETDLRQQVISNLSNKKELQPVLFELVGDRHADMEVRESAVIWLNNLNDPNSIPYLINALSDRPFQYRHYVASLLGRFDDPRAVKALTKASSDRNKEVRVAAREALKYIEFLQSKVVK